MSLNFDLSKIENYAEKCWQKDEDGERGKIEPLTHSLIFATMAVGIGTITEENADEFYARAYFVGKIDGAPMWKRDEDGKMKDYFFTLEDVRSHIGLSCNVSNESRKTWLQRFDREIDDIKRRAK